MMDVWIVFPLAIIAVVAATFIVVGRVTNKRMASELSKVEKWGDLPVEERLHAHTKFTEEYIRGDAARLRNSITFSASVAAAGLLMVVWLDDSTSEFNDQTTENCRNFRTLVNIQAEDLNDDIRAATNERDELADAILNSPIDLTQLPGYADLPQAARIFLTGLLDAQVEEGEAALERLDSDIARLRIREDTISGFASTLDCP